MSQVDGLGFSWPTCLKDLLGDMCIELVIIFLLHFCSRFCCSTGRAGCKQHQDHGFNIQRAYTDGEKNLYLYYVVNVLCTQCDMQYAF